MSQTISRPLSDFLDPATQAKAGIIEIRQGSHIFKATEGVPSSVHINTLEYDSRSVKPGSLYFALPGLHADGHDYIHDAIKRGAIAVVHQNDLSEYSEGIVFIKVKNSRFAMSPIADAFNDYPSRRMTIIGVTGTEGKSTTVCLIHQLLTLAGKKAGFISTVMQGDGINVNWTAEHQTTPEATATHMRLAEMYRNGAEYAVLESSSHGLSKRTNRLGDVAFDVGVMTTVAHDHLEFHGSWEQYRYDKAELFRALDTSPHKKQGMSGDFTVPAFGVANADDPSADYFAAATKHRTYTFSTKGAKADLSVKSIKSSSDGNEYEVTAISGRADPGRDVSGAEISNSEIFTIIDELPGAFNAGNVLAALLVVSKLLSMEIIDLIPHVRNLKPIRGRMTSVCLGQPFEVIVDYAHTPSSFEAIYPSLRERLNASGGRIISLTGSAGERDTKKRPQQGEIAARYSEIVLLADEDPRSEVPMTILEEIAAGCEKENHMKRNENLFLMPDRPEAIRKAFSLARKGDLVLLLGKAHENSIIYKDFTLPYDEINEAEKALREMGYSGNL